MAGKRSDQHNLDPGEGKATDYKFRRTPADGLEHPTSKEGGQPIKPTVPSPDANNPTAKKNKDAAQDNDG
jgi:hypothetical protein